MDWNFDHQCTADSSGSSKPEYFSQHAGISFIFRYLFPVFGIARLADFLFYNVATGPMIVIVAAIIYFATYVYGRRNA